MTGVPYWRLSAFYFFFFATLGALIPYWGLYLKSLGMRPDAIGLLMGLLMLTKVVAPNVWGWMADRRGVRLPIIRWAAFLAVVGFSGVLLGDSMLWLVVVTVVFRFFWNAALPQFEAVTLTHLGRATHRYTRIRVWGSVGFIVTVIAVGVFLDHFPVVLLPLVVLVFMAGIWLATLTAVEHSGAPVPTTHEPLAGVLRRPEVWAVLLGCFLMQASHGPYYAFFSIYLEAYGYSRGLIGQLWALGVVAEVLLFLVMPRLLQRYSMRHLFLACFALTGLRWILVAAFPQWLAVIFGAQLLHAASFGIYHAVAIQLVHRFFVGANQGRGQALYSSVSFGAGGALGSVLSGYAWAGIGPQATYLGAAAVSLVGLVVVWRWVEVAPMSGSIPSTE